MVSMPRSARLAAWANVWLRAGCTLDDVLTRVCTDDEPHDVVDVPGSVSTSNLVTALSTLRDTGVTAFRVALPAPGDPVGLGGPPDLTADAVDAREVVLAIGPDGGPQATTDNATTPADVPAVSSAYALVPDVRAFGPPGDQGHLVTWRCRTAAPPPPGPELNDAEQTLATTLLETSSTLTKLDIAAWRPEVAALLEDVRSSQVAEPLPRAFSPKAQMVAARSIRLLAVAEFALDDDGGAVSASTAQSRRDALAPLERSARHALVAACNSLTP